MPFAGAAYLVFILSVQPDYPDLLLPWIPFVGKVIDRMRYLVHAHNIRHFKIARRQLFDQGGLTKPMDFLHRSHRDRCGCAHPANW